MKKRGNSRIGGDKKTRDKMKIRNPRGNKKGGKTSSKTRKGINTKVHLLECNLKTCKC